MNWDIIIAYALGGMFVSLVNIYGWCKLEDKKIDFKNYKFYLAFIILIILGTALNYFAPAYVKLFVMLFLLFIVNYFLITKNFEKCIASVIIIQGITMIAETFAALIVSNIIGNYANFFMLNPMGVLCLNLIVTILIILSLKLKCVHSLYTHIIKIFENIKRNNIVLCCLITIILVLIFMVLSYIDLPNAIVLLINSILIIFYVFIIFKLMNVETKLKNVSDKYEMSLTSLKEYEKIMNNYRVDNHENKNQLIIIRGMVNTENKALIKYIDKLVGEKLTQKEKAFYKVEKIPEGGLRAIIYSKISKMNDIGINYSLDISNDVNTTDLININDKLMVDICKTMGVFLDNAIEAVTDLQDKEITIEIYKIDNRLCVEIANTYSGTLELDKMDCAGHTTKGEGHGYGLTLVSKIVRSNRSLENERTIDGNMFSQKLYIILNNKKIKNKTK